MKMLVKRRLIKTLLLTSVLFGGSACSSLNVAVPGLEHFNLEGELPADFSSTITTFYYPTQYEGCIRIFYGYGTGSVITEPHKHYAIFDTARNPRPQHITQKIPLYFMLEGCKLRLLSIDFKVVGHYGSDPGFDTFSSRGKLDVVEKRTKQTLTFPANHTLELRGLCTSLFQVSSVKDRLTKQLTCHKADKHWRTSKELSEQVQLEESVVRNELQGKTIKMAFRINTEELPAYKNTWVKVKEGWKLCRDRDGHSQCLTPPKFGTFNMNGRECTVYPNCTE